MYQGFSKILQILEKKSHVTKKEPPCKKIGTGDFLFIETSILRFESLKH